jgi:endonuclease-8
MPEGDTVHLTARQQNAALAGAVLTGFELRVPAFATADLSGETVREVVARGKHLFHRIGDYSLHSHLKMEGAWRLYRPGERWRRPAFQARAVLSTQVVQAVGFDLGITELIRTADENQVVGHLGPDLLGADWDAVEAERRLSADAETPVYVALLDQRNLAGIGNVYANELCFLRGLLPTRTMGEVTDVAALVALARRLLTANADRWTRNTVGSSPTGPRTWVYGRADRPCQRCGTRLLSGELGRVPGEERHVVWCPHCQR